MYNIIHETSTGRYRFPNKLCAFRTTGAIMVFPRRAIFFLLPRPARARRGFARRLAAVFLFFFVFWFFFFYNLFSLAGAQTPRGLFRRPPPPPPRASRSARGPLIDARPSVSGSGAGRAARAAPHRSGRRPTDRATDRPTDRQRLPPYSAPHPPARVVCVSPAPPPDPIDGTTRNKEVVAATI